MSRLSRGSPRPAIAVCLALTLAAAALPAGTPEDTLRLSDVEFPHALHADDLGFDCADCHHETDAAALSIPHEEYFSDFWIECGTCHRDSSEPTAPQACSNCHHDSPTDVADETLSSKVVIHRSCWSCHEIGTGAAAGAGCATCHERYRAGAPGEPAEEAP